MRGRKPAYESRATEFRQRLIVWEQTPKALRPPLRTLADELGTSHQMLSYYRTGLDIWRAKEEAKRIHARAAAEGREMTVRECLDAFITPGVLRQIEELGQAARRGPLNRHQVQILKLYGRAGSPGAKRANQILEKCRQMTPEEEKQSRAAERRAMFASAVRKHIARIRQEAERGPLPWRDIQILKALARGKCGEAKELLQKYSKTALPRPQVPQ